MHKVISAAALLAATAALPGCGGSDGPRLLVYCAASLRPAIEPLAARFERERGVAIELQYGGSNALVAQAQLSSRGDVLVVADRFYADAAVEQGFADHLTPIGRMRAVLLHRADSPPPGDRLAEVLAAAPRTAIGNPEAAAIGRATRAALSQAGEWAHFESLIETSGVYTPTVDGAAQAVLLGAVDVAVVWDVTARRNPTLRVKRLRALDEVRAEAAAVRLASSQAPQKAGELLAWLAADEGGRPEFRRLGLAAP